MIRIIQRVKDKCLIVYNIRKVEDYYTYTVSGTSEYRTTKTETEDNIDKEFEDRIIKKGL